MCGNGARTGMTITAVAVRRILQAHLRPLFACSVVAVGPATRGTAVCRSGAASRQTTATSSSASVLPFSDLPCKIKERKLDVKIGFCVKAA